MNKIFVLIACICFHSMLAQQSGDYEPTTQDSLDLTSEVLHDVKIRPVYPGCEMRLNLEEQEKCTDVSIARFLQMNFNLKIIQRQGIGGKQKVYVMFKVDEKGSVKDVRARSTNKKLEDEALKAMRKLPKMKPGFQDGATAVMTFALPITFNLPVKKSMKNR